MSEENLHIDFSIAFTAKTARIDVVLDELSNDDNSLKEEDLIIESHDLEEDDNIRERFIKMFKDYKKINKLN